MSVIFCDSFDHYTTILQKWSATSGVPSISSLAARTGANGLRYNAVGGQVSVTKNITSIATVIIGFAFNIQVLPSAAKDFILCAFNDASGNSQCFLKVSPTGTLQFYRGNNTNNNSAGIGTAIGPSGSIGSGAWHYVEVKVTIDPSAGVVECNVDGGQIITASSLNTRGVTNSSVSSISLGSYLDNDGSGTFWYDDVYFINTSSPNSTYLGDVAVEMNLPTGDGSSLQWTPNSGTPHFSRVNENPPDDDTSYNSDATVSDIDYYTYGNISSTAGTVAAVVVNLRARKDDAGTRSIRAQIKSPASSGTAADNGADFAQATSYADFQGIFETDPNTSAAWTVAAVNAAEYGIKTTA
jgi:hypothetical protein